MDTTQHAERHRQLTLDTLAVLDTASEPEFEAIVTAARRLFGSPIGFVSLVDGDRVVLKARQGLELNEIPRDCSICALAIEREEIITVEDLQDDPAYKTNPLVSEAPDLRFFATIPLRGPVVENESVLIGSLCVIGQNPHRITDEELAEMHSLAAVIERLFEARLAARRATQRHEVSSKMIAEFQRTHRQFDMAEQLANIGSWRLDLATEQVHWSKQTRRIYGLEGATDEELGRAMDFFPPADRARVADAIARCVADGTPYDLELDFRDARGRSKRVRAMGEIERERGKTVALIGVFQDITQRHRLEQRLREAAFTDQLTGLANRRRLNEYLSEEIERARRLDERLAVALIDLDHFKLVNDRFGHEAGDRVLRSMAARLRAEPFAGQFSARLGGDELILVVRDAALLDDLAGTLEKLTSELRLTVGKGEETVTVTATIGAAWLDDAMQDRSELLACADLALYRAKDNQRGTAALYAPLADKAPGSGLRLVR